ncbi:Uncharacterised protein [Mycobacteroides abscessus subsp. abscessus]|nr:Uncharacterised protein [Mycobacteroides abscessus subsp. abscessus]SLC99237.1 Uncharacterised protein [Mycobacteroides abscessus subsp. massiliense]
MFGFESDEPIVSEDGSDDLCVGGDPPAAGPREPTAFPDLVDDAVDVRGLADVDTQLRDGLSPARKHFQIGAAYPVGDSPMGALFDPVLHPSDPRVGSLDAKRTPSTFEINCWPVPGRGRGSPAGFRSHAGSRVYRE